MQVKLSEIPEEGLDLKINDVSWFPDDEIRRTEDLKARMFLERRPDRLMANGSIDLVFVFDCDRCLESFHKPQTIEFSLTLERKEDAEIIMSKEHHCDSSEMDVVFFEKNVIDIDTILGQQVLLANPVKKLCKVDCLGLCKECGANLNRKECPCPKKRVDSPFGVLGQFLNE